MTIMIRIRMKHYNVKLEKLNAKLATKAYSIMIMQDGKPRVFSYVEEHFIHSFFVVSFIVVAGFTTCSQQTLSLVLM